MSARCTLSAQKGKGDREMDTNQEIARQLAGYLAQFMSGGQSLQEWKVDPDRNPDAQGAHITEQETGATVYVYLDWRNTDRVIVESKYPAGSSRAVYPEPQVFKMTADRYRDPAKIAGDVLRKVAVPEFFAEHKRCVEELAHDAAAFKLRQEVAARVASAFDVPNSRYTIAADSPESSHGEVSFWGCSGPVPREVWLSHNADRNKVTVEELTPDQVVKVLELVASFYG